VGAVIGNNVLLAWKDNRSGIEATERIYGKTGLWARQMNSQSMFSDEPELPYSNLSLRQNYPILSTPAPRLPFI
jgi:hypothetical protein